VSQIQLPPSLLHTHAPSLPIIIILIVIIIIRMVIIIIVRLAGLGLFIPLPRLWEFHSMGIVRQRRSFPSCTPTTVFYYYYYYYY